MKICIIGRPSSGKTTALQVLNKNKFNTFCTDEYIKEIYSYGKKGYKLIKKHFGVKYVTKNGVNKKKLGELVFSNVNKLNKLNKLMIPIIINKIKNLDNKKKWFIELGIYLFYHEKFKNLFDKIILISTDQKWYFSSQLKKFKYLKNKSTFIVDNFIKIDNFIFNNLNIIGKINNDPKINVDIMFINSKSKKNFQKNILKICKNLN